METVNEALNYDLAIEILQSMRVKTERTIDSAQTETEKKEARALLKLYNMEEKILNGWDNDFSRQSVYDKVFRFYAPLVRPV